jgi:hypothetical protein
MGNEFQINTYTTQRQWLPAAAMDRGGDFVVVWQSGEQDGNASGIFGQRFDALGTLLGEEFRVNTYTTSEQWFPAVTMEPNGSFVVVWESVGQYYGGRGIFGQRFGGGGEPLGGEFQVNSFTGGFQLKPDVGTDGTGNSLVAWTSDLQDGSATGVFAQRFDSSGAPLGGEFQVNSHTTGYQRYPSLAIGPDGGFVVAWESVGQDGDRTGVFGRRFDALGAPLGGDFQVNTYTTDYQRDPAIDTDLYGNFVVVWESYRQDGSRSGVFGQRLDASGVRLGEEFQVNAHTTEAQRSPSVESLSGGGFVVVWESADQDGNDLGVFGRRFAADGLPMGTEFQINAYTTGAQGAPTIVADPAGNFVVGWESYGQDGDQAGVFGTRVAVTSLSLAAAGQCPGFAEVSVLNAPPSSEVAVLSGANANGYVKGGALCNGTRLEIGEPFALPPTWVRVDGNGNGSAHVQMREQRCWLEALALADCQTSGAVLVPGAIGDGEPVGRAGRGCR